MSIEITEEGEVARFTVVGFWNTDEVIQVLDAYYGGTPCRDALWDLRKASLSDFRPEDFQRLGARSAQIAANRGPGARTALVVAERMNELLVEAYCQMINPNTPIDFQHFLTPEEARAWLGEAR